MFARHCSYTTVTYMYYSHYSFLVVRANNYRNSGKHTENHSSNQFRTQAQVKCKNCGGD